MATIYGKNEFGYFTNGKFETGTNVNFTFGAVSASDAYNGQYCLQRVGGGGASAFSTEYIPVDTSQSYQMSAYVRTLQTGSQNGSLAGGHIGFACYDKNKTFIDIIQCGGIGNTTLSRDLNAGDSYVYISSSAGWSTNESTLYRYVLIYPPTHPDYSVPHQYTRIGYLNPTIIYSSSIQLMGEGDYRLTLVNASNVPVTMSNIGYTTPAGTPVSNGQAGGSYNYALGFPNFPLTWTRYATPPFTGESRNSTYPFRWATKFIRFLILMNYNFRLETPQDHIWALDNIFWGICLHGKDYRGGL